MEDLNVSNVQFNKEPKAKRLWVWLTMTTQNMDLAPGQCAFTHILSSRENSSSSSSQRHLIV